MDERKAVEQVIKGLHPMKAGIEKQIHDLFREVRYWPMGLYFRSRSHKEFMLQLQDYAKVGDHCLDLGCGQKARYKPFIEAHGLVWYGADNYESTVPPQANYHPVKNGRLDFDDGMFDVICTYNVIEHFDDPERMFAEIARCTKPGGVLCGAVAFWEMEHDSYFHLTQKGLRAILERHGFELLSLLPSEYSGVVLVAQRFWGGSGRVLSHSRRLRLYSLVLGTLNWIPFLIICCLEGIRKNLFRFLNDPLRDCATLYFFASKVKG